MLGKLTTIITTLRALRVLRAHNRWSRSEVLAHQATACTALREFAYQHSPFYRAFHRGYEQAPLHELPVLTKATMMEHFDDFVTDRDLRLADIRAHLAADPAGRFRDSYEVVTTSGHWEPGHFPLQSAGVGDDHCLLRPRPRVGWPAGRPHAPLPYGGGVVGE
jgi:hypothetical protein